MDYRQQRRAYREQRRAYRGYRNPLRGVAGGIFFIGLALAIFLSSRFGGTWFISIFFIGLALSSLIGSISSFNRWGIYGGLHGFFWLMALALFFITGSWVWWLVAIGASMILGALLRPIMAGSLGVGFMGAANMANQPPQPYQQHYQQGYQPQAQQETYQEGGQQRQYPQPQYDQPQAPYPEESRQELPPQQQ